MAILTDAQVLQLAQNHVGRLGEVWANMTPELQTAQVSLVSALLLDAALYVKPSVIPIPPHASPAGLWRGRVVHRGVKG